MTVNIDRPAGLGGADLEALVALLQDVVEAGASVSFMAPLSHDDASAFWHQVAADSAAGNRALLVARDPAGRIVGTVQLVLAQPPNQPHRADLAKLLVHPDARRQGVAESLMRAVEPVALAAGKWLLVLDTANATAERLYDRLGWSRVGAVPDFALLPHGGLCATTFFFKSLKA